ncbi:hypothetical protein [Streptomyces reniochalinae]|uniref:Secreted protein n=1 Tax=Streptomyces reniochalinae TaxID=2250578 RepID=A0A367ED32_9ACTN|nr:hypothetical protein [Streptomyces reniochalinae]RCG15976.1 hypothetical protein DQ392_23320 [Streptomyces reniochalinae]
MDDNVRELVLGLVAAAITAAAGWFARTSLWRRQLHKRQRFFGLPENSGCLLVVNHDPATDEGAVARNDVFALLELSALVKDCGARMEMVGHDAARRGFGEHTEFCLGGPGSNQRTAAHLETLLPGVAVNTDAEPGLGRAAFTVGGEHYRMEEGSVEYVLLARLTGASSPAGPKGERGDGEAVRPVFLICGQRSLTNQAAARYLARHQVRLARRHGHGGDFCLLLRVVNSRAYGPDVVELVADVTREATASQAR